MKRKDLLKEIALYGYKLVRNGANHDVYSNGTRSEAIPRHSEINEITAKAIIKRVSENKGANK